MNIVEHEVEIITAAGSMPSELIADLTGLDIGASIHLRHLALPVGVSLAAHEDDTIASITAPTISTADEEATAAAAAAASDAAAAAAAPAAPRRREVRLRRCVCWWGWATLARLTPAIAIISASWRWTKSSAAIRSLCGALNSKDKWPRGNVAGEKVLALKPDTFMNLSGQSVAAAAHFHKIASADIVVIHDDMDLVPGKLRVKRGGGAGGHNGLRSIDAHLGNDYWRIRLGIGHPVDRSLVTQWVLSNFAKADAEWISPLFDVVAEQLPLVFNGEVSSFMNKVAQVMSSNSGHVGGS